MPLFGKGRGDGAPRGFVKALEDILDDVPGRGDLVGYVLSGNPADALNSLTQAQGLYGVARHHLLSPDRPQGRQKMAALYADVAGVDSAVLRRYGRLLDAAWGRAQWGLSMGQVTGGSWFELMIFQAGAGTAPSQPLPLTFADLVRAADVDGAG